MDSTLSVADKRRRMTSLPTSTISLLHMACCKFHLCAANLVGQLGARTDRWRMKDSPRRQWLYSSGSRDRRRSKDSARSLMWRLTDLLLHSRRPFISASLMIISPFLAMRRRGETRSHATGMLIIPSRVHELTLEEASLRSWSAKSSFLATVSAICEC
ncbi:hypothetical protein BGZ61DRAFT_27826 [Ilyonectria robusta]|uniref:uncharacterized protein n=1 Tax=Ilyonectria robusta TaxID=1079257 RepID=UPI001E8EDE6E|nr:uncharacterized protein BGZ61DRAFT_27826 [Ilyonectria robusta]KAH8738091.1 hypothetical protein BGZ61DRAFT_27826 [Ilyonectria robusta]